jgi:hypothetical protein
MALLKTHCDVGVSSGSHPGYNQADEEFLI